MSSIIRIIQCSRKFGCVGNIMQERTNERTNEEVKEETQQKQTNTPTNQQTKKHPKEHTHKHLNKQRRQDVPLLCRVTYAIAYNRIWKCPNREPGYKKTNDMHRKHST